MSNVTWSTPLAQSADLAGTALNGVAAAGVSTGINYDNSTNKALYARVSVRLAWFAPSAGGSIMLRVTSDDGSNMEDAAATPEDYSRVVLAGAGAKIIVFPLVRLYPWSLQFHVINNTDAAFAAGPGNTLKVSPYGEAVT